MIQKVLHWIYDYAYAFYKKGVALAFREPPGHYLGHVVAGKDPVVVIPGLNARWHFLSKLIDEVSQKGHPIYVIKELGYNRAAIHSSAARVYEFIKSRHLKHVIIVAHSKGGLIGKYILAHHNKEQEVKKMIAVAAPFAGSRAAQYVPAGSTEELRPSSEVVQKLQSEETVNRHIISIYGVSDNFVWPVESAQLKGAKNIQVDTHGHHTIFLDKNVRSIILREIESL